MMPVEPVKEFSPRNKIVKHGGIDRGIQDVDAFCDYDVGGDWHGTAEDCLTVMVLPDMSFPAKFEANYSTEAQIDGSVYRFRHFESLKVWEFSRLPDTADKALK